MSFRTLGIVAFSFAMTVSAAQAKRHAQPPVAHPVAAPTIKWPPAPPCADGSVRPIVAEDTVNRMRTYGECPEKEAPKVVGSYQTAQEAVMVTGDTVVHVQCHLSKLQIVLFNEQYATYHCGSSQGAVPGFDSMIGVTRRNGAVPTKDSLSAMKFNGTYYEISMGQSDAVFITFSGQINPAAESDVRPVRTRHHKK